MVVLQLRNKKIRFIMFKVQNVLAFLTSKRVLCNCLQVQSACSVLWHLFQSKNKRKGEKAHWRWVYQHLGVSPKYWSTPKRWLTPGEKFILNRK